MVEEIGKYLDRIGQTGSLHIPVVQKKAEEKKSSRLLGSNWVDYPRDR